MPNKQQPNRPRSRRRTTTRRTGWWVVLAFVIVAAVAGTAIQSSRAQSSTAGATPHHLLGPANSEIQGSPAAPVLVRGLIQRAHPRLTVPSLRRSSPSST